MAVPVKIEELLERFWSCEDVGSAKAYSPEELRCEELYERTVQRGPDGRFTVTLPKHIDGLTRIGESRDIALQRLCGLERRLRKNPALRLQ